MTKLRFAFHNPRGERGIGKTIVGLTWLYALFYGWWKALKYSFSHVEVWLPDEWEDFRYWHENLKLYHPEMEWRYLGHCFSSTTRGVYNGVRFAPASEVIGKHPDRWSYIEVEVDPERLEVALEEAKKLVGLKYDYWGVVLGFLNPFPIQHDKRWYCSEISHWFARLCGLKLKRTKRISPRRLAYVLAKVGHEPRRLL